MNEFELIAVFLKAFRGRTPSSLVRVGPGDDCAVLAPARGETCVTTDAVVEGVHFTRPAFSWAEIGHKALAVNLSDLAAMGAKPSWFVCAIAARSPLAPKDVRALAAGMASLARTHRIALVGGNFTSASQLAITITAAGTSLPGRALLRSGGQPGDVLYVSGTLGDARAGLSLLAQGTRKGSLVERQRRPTPRVALGQLASAYAHAAIDLSDGLAQDLGHLCARSRVDAEVLLSQLPLSRAFKQAARRLRGAARWPLHGGEDYELLLAVPPARSAAFERACARRGELVTPVGRLLRGRGQVRLVTGERGASRLLQGGFDHFAKDKLAHPRPI